MNTAELKLLEQLHDRLGNIEISMEYLTELCQDTGEIEIHQTLLKEFQSWRSRLKNRLPIICSQCNHSDWREETVVQLCKGQKLRKGNHLEVVWRGPSTRYTCVNCGYILETE